MRLFAEETNTNLISQALEEGVRYSRYWPRSLVEKVCSILKKLYAFDQSKRPDKRYLIMSGMYQLASYFISELPKRNISEVNNDRYSSLSKQTMSTLHRIFEYVDSNFSKNITLEDVAQEVGYSTSYFARFFKWNTGQTFMNFLRQYRVNKAKIILLNEKVPITEVSERAGFSSLKSFYRSFKAEEKIPPLQYQKKFANIN